MAGKKKSSQHEKKYLKRNTNINIKYIKLEGGCSSFIIFCLFVFHFVNNAREPNAFFTCLGEKNKKMQLSSKCTRLKKKERKKKYRYTKGKDRKHPSSEDRDVGAGYGQKPAASSQGMWWWDAATRGAAHPTASISLPQFTLSVSPLVSRGFLLHLSFP